MSSYIQLPYGFIKKSEPIQLNLPKNYEESQYLSRLPYLSNKGPALDNEILDKLKNREDLQKWLLATSDFSREIQEDVNAIVGHHENFNNAVIRRALDLKNAGVFQNPNPLTVVFCDIKKFDVQNPIIGKLATQVKASKLTEDQISKNILMKDEIAKIEDRLTELKKPIRFNNDDKDSDDSDDNVHLPAALVSESLQLLYQLDQYHHLIQIKLIISN